MSTDIKDNKDKSNDILIDIDKPILDASRLSEYLQSYLNSEPLGISIFGVYQAGDLDPDGKRVSEEKIGTPPPIRITVPDSANDADIEDLRKAVETFLTLPESDIKPEPIPDPTTLIVNDAIATAVAPVTNDIDVLKAQIADLLRRVAKLEKP